MFMFKIIICIHTEPLIQVTKYNIYAGKQSNSRKN